MRWALLTGLLCLIASALSAQSQPADTTPIYRMNREQFLALAGPDDTLRAVVNLFFRKRKTASTLLSVAGASLGVFVVASTYAVLRAAGPGGSNPADDIQVLAQATSAVIYTTGVTGAVRLMRYPRKRLKQIIANRNEGQPLAARYVRRLRPADFE
jgi:hypothetical protein